MCNLSASAQFLFLHGWEGQPESLHSLCMAALRLLPRVPPCCRCYVCALVIPDACVAAANVCLVPFNSAGQVSRW